MFSRRYRRPTSNQNEAEQFMNTSLGRMLYYTGNLVPFTRQVIVINAAVEPNLYDAKIFDKLNIGEILSRTTCDMAAIHRMQHITEYTLFECVILNHYITDEIAVELALRVTTYNGLSQPSRIQQEHAYTIIPSDDESIDVQPEENNEYMAEFLRDVDTADEISNADQVEEAEPVFDLHHQGQYNLFMQDEVAINGVNVPYVVPGQSHSTAVEANTLTNQQRAQRVYELWKQLLAKGRLPTAFEDNGGSDPDAIIKHYEKLLAECDEMNSNIAEPASESHSVVSQDSFNFDDYFSADYGDDYEVDAATLRDVVDEGLYNFYFLTDSSEGEDSLFD
ncbi:uncharacterized protein LOC119689340 [Teleopsis dalmanni]|uniref:uncharacterized protein LOC119689340 n=1 Tax=Teleopsis dalmanni TaxID=139649 RepID=UPI000D32ABA0|nr:uncharacterized protein LOC119689340 [Teleopsis dalmanni]